MIAPTNHNRSQPGCDATRNRVSDSRRRRSRQSSTARPRDRAVESPEPRPRALTRADGPGARHVRNLSSETHFVQCTPGAAGTVIGAGNPWSSEMSSPLTHNASSV